MMTVDEILTGLSILTEEHVDWSPLEFRVRIYLTSVVPELDLVTSVRALVRNGDQVLTVRDLKNTHILPGGRREAGESLIATLEREIREETGWNISNPRLLGIIHFHHLTPQPAEYRFPYPDFLQLVYLADATTYDASVRQVDGYELEAHFQPIEAVRALPLTKGERTILEAS